MTNAGANGGDSGKEAAYRSVALSDDARTVTLLDQRVLPGSVEYIDLRGSKDVARAIKDMVVRGAPAIGATAAYGLASALTLGEELTPATETLLVARPTAVNLRWAVERVSKAYRGRFEYDGHDAAVAAAVADARAIGDEDDAINRRMGAHGAELLPQNARVLHHCNTGALATVGWGTALGVIHSAFEAGKLDCVWVDETRPRLQGARLTAWELMRLRIPMRLIVDGASGLLMRKGLVDAVTVGADRIAANGDTANKIGTYNVAALAKLNKVPFYVVAPTSTIDVDVANGDDIPIEERDAAEILEPTGDAERAIAPEGVEVYNPAFDITPAELVTAIVTEMGVIYPPFEANIRALF